MAVALSAVNSDESTWYSFFLVSRCSCSCSSSDDSCLFSSILLSSCSWSCVTTASSSCCCASSSTASWGSESSSLTFSATSSWWQTSPSSTVLFVAFSFASSSLLSWDSVSFNNVNSRDKRSFTFICVSNLSCNTFTSTTFSPALMVTLSLISALIVELITSPLVAYLIMSCGLAMVVSSIVVVDGGDDLAAAEVLLLFWINNKLAFNVFTSCTNASRSDVILPNILHFSTSRLTYASSAFTKFIFRVDNSSSIVVTSSWLWLAASSTNTSRSRTCVSISNRSASRSFVIATSWSRCTISVDDVVDDDTSSTMLISVAAILASSTNLGSASALDVVAVVAVVEVLLSGSPSFSSSIVPTCSIFSSSFSASSTTISSSPSLAAPSFSSLSSLFELCTLLNISAVLISNFSFNLSISILLSISYCSNNLRLSCNVCISLVRFFASSWSRVISTWPSSLDFVTVEITDCASLSSRWATLRSADVTSFSSHIFLSCVFILSISCTWDVCASFNWRNVLVNWSDLVRNSITNSSLLDDTDCNSFFTVVWLVRNACNSVWTTSNSLAWDTPTSCWAVVHPSCSNTTRPNSCSISYNSVIIRSFSFLSTFNSSLVCVWCSRSSCNTWSLVLAHFLISTSNLPSNSVIVLESSAKCALCASSTLFASRNVLPLFSLSNDSSNLDTSVLLLSNSVRNVANSVLATSDWSRNSSSIRTLALLNSSTNISLYSSSFFFSIISLSTFNLYISSVYDCVVSVSCWFNVQFLVRNVSRSFFRVRKYDLMVVVSECKVCSRSDRSEKSVWCDVEVVDVGDEMLILWWWWWLLLLSSSSSIKLDKVGSNEGERTDVDTGALFSLSLFCIHVVSIWGETGSSSSSSSSSSGRPLSSSSSITSSDGGGGVVVLLLLSNDGWLGADGPSGNGDGDFRRWPTVVVLVGIVTVVVSNTASISSSESSK